MARITPKTNWTAANIPVAPDFNRIENNNEQAFTELDAETAARQAAITAEQNARTAAIGVETTNRQNADTTLQNNINNHVGTTGTFAHNASFDNDASSIMARDLNGRTNITSPITTSHAATKGYVDTADATLQGNIDTANASKINNASLGSRTLTASPMLGSSTIIIPAGTYAVLPGTPVSLQIQDSGGSWRSFGDGNDFPLVVSDGINVRLVNSSTDISFYNLIKFN